MTASGINRGAPAIRSTGQTDFALLLADTDGMKEAFLCEEILTTFEGSDLDGALMAVDGSIDGDDARNITLTLANIAGGFVAGSEVFVYGQHPYYNCRQVEKFIIPGTDGNTILVGAKMFRSGYLMKLVMPVGSRASTRATILALWDFAPADTLTLKIDGGGVETATWDAAVAVANSAIETYNLDDGDILTVTITNLDSVNVTFAGLPADAITSNNAEPYDLADGETLLVTIDDNNETVTVNTADFVDIDAATAAELAAAINADCTGSPAADVGGYVVLSSLLEGGTDSEVHVTGGTMTAPDFPTDENLGTGNVAKIELITADEIVTLLNVVLVGATADKNTNKVRITNDAPAGTDSKIAVSGTANVVLAFDALTSGTGDVGNIDTVTYTEFKTVLEADTNAECELIGGYVSVYKPLMVSGNSMQITGGNVATAMGFDTDVHAAGGFTAGCGVAREITPPANWLWINVAGTLYVHLRSDDDGRILKCIVSTGAQPISADALHENTNITDLWAAPEEQ